MFTPTTKEIRETAKAPMSLKRCEHAIVMIDDDQIMELGWYDDRMLICQCELKTPKIDKYGLFHCTWTACVKCGEHSKAKCFDYIPIQIPTICFSGTIKLENNMEII